MTPGQMQVHRRVGELGMSEQELDGTEIGAGFEHMRREAVTERVRRDARFAAAVTAVQATVSVTGTSARQLFSMPGNR
jgi:hypothetical protein